MKCGEGDERTERSADWPRPEGCKGEVKSFEPVFTNSGWSGKS